MNHENIFLFIFALLGVCMIIWPLKLRPLITFHSWLSETDVGPWYVRAIGIMFIFIAITLKF